MPATLIPVVLVSGRSTPATLVPSVVIAGVPGPVTLVPIVVLVATVTRIKTPRPAGPTVWSLRPATIWAAHGSFGPTSGLNVQAVVFEVLLIEFFVRVRHCDSKYCIPEYCIR